MDVKPQIESSWYDKLKDEFYKDYFKEIKSTLLQDKEAGNDVYPKGSDIFKAFDKTPFEAVKVVILGQDPYHNPGQAHGLSFSVPEDVKQPPSLKNIFKELKEDLNIDPPSHGNLEKRAREGVLLLNAILTVRAHHAASHHNIGWQNFTDEVIKTISEEKEGVVFLLRGKFAQSKKNLIDTNKHYILEAPHPSPYSANKGFFGCNHFSKTNEILKSLGKEPIDWKIED